MKGRIPLRLDCPETILSPALLRFYLFPLEEVKQTFETKLLNFLRTIVAIGLVAEDSTVFSYLFGSIFERTGEQSTLLPSVFLSGFVLLGISLKMAILWMEDYSTLGACSIVDTILYLLLILKLVLLLFYLLYKLLTLSFETMLLSVSFLDYTYSLALKKFPIIVSSYFEDDILRLLSY